MFSGLSFNQYTFYPNIMSNRKVDLISQRSKSLKGYKCEISIDTLHKKFSGRF